MKNKLTDLNDHLFAQLERLSDESLSAEEIAKEVQRAQAVVQVADCIVANAGVQLKAVQLAADHGGFVKVPFMQIEVKEQ
jgi:hypothetical protein